MAALDNFTYTYALANKLMQDFGLIEAGWRFDFDNGKRRMGCCHYTDKKITISQHFLNSPRSEIEDTIRHEIAHALAGYKAGHGYEWQRMAISCGAKPTRCYQANNVVNEAKHNYEIHCTGCGKVWKMFRLRKNYTGKKSACCHAELKHYKIERS
jgi:predicted SprT family Zn-dependent metalloprotease